MKLSQLSVDLVPAIAYLHQVLGLDDLIDLTTAAAASLVFFLLFFTIRARFSYNHLAKQVNESFLACVKHTEKRDMMTSLTLDKLLQVKLLLQLLVCLLNKSVSLLSCLAPAAAVGRNVLPQKTASGLI